MTCSIFGILELQTVTAEGGGEGGHAPRAALSRGRHFKEDKTNSAGVRSFKRFTKCTKFIFGGCSASYRYARWGAPVPTLSSRDGTSGKEGRQDEHLPRAPQTFAPPLITDNLLYV